MRGRQLRYARLELGTPSVTAEDFDLAATSFGFEAAVLLDEAGTALAVSPQKPSLVGTDLSGQYAHLAEAVAGRDAVSNVVSSAAKGEPIIAVAVPFETRSGRRVISGGYQLAKSPLTAFLGATSSLRGREVYLLDAASHVIASTETTVVGPLGLGAAPLADAPIGATTLAYDGESHFVVATLVEGTQWRLLAAVPASELHLPVQGARSSWLLVAATAAMALAVLRLLGRSVGQREDLRRLSRTDALTGLANRGHADEVMTRAAAVSARTGQPWAVAMMDIDRFKSVNDRLGHAGGDLVLRHVAAVIAEQTRTSDLCARWGGEEFVVIMEGSDLAAAMVASRRLAAAVRRVVTTDGFHMTVSIGAASGTGGAVDHLVRRADEALYEAKRTGRDRVVPAPSIEPLVDAEGLATVR